MNNNNIISFNFFFIFFFLNVQKSYNINATDDDLQKVKINIFSKKINLLMDLL